MKTISYFQSWMVSVVTSIFFCVNANGQWSTNPTLNNAICTASNDQHDNAMISDGAGGVILTWSDNRSGNYDIYAQRIDSLGNILWQTNGIPICTGIDFQFSPVIILDNFGDVIISWIDHRSGSADIYAQKVNSSGSIKWMVNGVPICTAPFTQGPLDMTSDGIGGAVISWRDDRNGTFDESIYAQRIDSTGISLWAFNGVLVCNSSGYKECPRIISDGVGGAILSWCDNRNSNLDIYTQRISSIGGMYWSNNGVPICTNLGHQYDLVITTDGSGGAIMVWHDYRNNDADIYTQRISSSGITQWLQDGMPICTESNDQVAPDIASGENGSALITWWDKRSGLGDYDVYCQKINTNGVIAWSNGGVPVSIATGNQNDSRLLSDGKGGAIITWHDRRGGTYDIYAQRVDSLGAPVWMNNGVPISTANNDQYIPIIVQTIQNGVIISWWDSRNGLLDIYAQKVNANGTLHCTTPQNTINITKCSNELPYIWNSQNLNTSGTFTFTTTNTEGCDSISVLHLSVYNTSSSFTNVANCQSYNWNGNTYTFSGIYTHTYINPNGCVHTDSLALTIYPNPTVNPISNQVFCSQQQTQPITLSGSPNGVTFDISGGTARGLPNQYDVTIIPSFTALNGTSVVIVTPKANGCIGTPSTFTLSVSNCPPVTLNLKFFIQGYYQGSGLMRSVLYNQGASNDPNSTVVDNVIVGLHSVSPPYAMVKTTIGTLNQNGAVSCTFSGSVTNTPFYIVVHHRNSIVTWSATQIIMAPNVSYDFTTMNSKSFGNNQVDVSANATSWAFYNGDVNQDDNIDLLDAAETEVDINNFEYGYYSTDLNGDGNVDLLDFLILELNITNFIFSSHP